MARLVLEGVSKAYGLGVRAVSDLDLEVRDEELLVLLGPSGCGKTTALRLIAGLEEPDAGTIRIGSRIVNGQSARLRDVAFVFQHSVLQPQWTVARNLAFGLKLRYGGNWFARAWRRMVRPAEAASLSEKRREMGDRVRDTARSLGIESLLDRRAWELSGGERQRVALGKAMVRRPAAFLFDEPLSSLDVPLRDDLRGLIRRLHDETRTTMLLVTHDQGEALRLGDRIAVMREGRVVQIGTPAEVWEWPRNKFVAEFVRGEPLNWWRGRMAVTEAGGVFDGPALRLKFAGPRGERTRVLAGGEVELAVRPEDVVLLRAPPSANESWVWLGEVARTELRGDSLLVTVAIAADAGVEQVPATRLVCKTGARTNVKAGERVGVRIDPDLVYLFDARSGDNLLTECL